MLSDTLAKERWAEGKGSNTLLLPRLQPHGSGSLSPLKGMEVSADPRALSTVIFAENPTFPNRIGTQRGYFESWMIEKPEASFPCCLKTDEALTHLINHIWGMQRSKNNLRFSQVLKKTLASRLCTNTVSCSMIHSDGTTLQYHYSTEDAISCEARATQDCPGLCTPSVWCFVVPLQLFRNNIWNLHTEKEGQGWALLPTC